MYAVNNLCFFNENEGEKKNRDEKMKHKMYHGVQFAMDKIISSAEMLDRIL